MIRRRGGIGRVVATLAAPLALGGCLAKQVVPLDCVPEEVQIYVDGELLADHPDMVELSPDEPHKIFFKRPGHEPQLVVLDSVVGPDGRPTLASTDACVDLVPVGVGRELVVEGEATGDSTP